MNAEIADGLRLTNAFFCVFRKIQCPRGFTTPQMAAALLKCDKAKEIHSNDQALWWSAGATWFSVILVPPTS